MTLQVRLTLLIISIFFLAVAAVVYRAGVQARVEVNREINAATELTLSLFDLSDIDDPVSGLKSQAAVQTFLENSAAVRHIRFATEETKGQIYENFLTELDETGVPMWFTELLKTQNPHLIHSVTLPVGDSLYIYSTPVDGIAEAWSETAEHIWSRLFSMGAFILLLLFFVGQWMRPVPVIVRVLREMAEGDYFRKVPGFPLPEFNEIGERINHLGTVLGASSAENNRLGRKAREIQEEERYYLAQELHDVQGQSMSAIKALAVMLQQRAHNITADEVEKSAEKIEDIAQKSYDSVRDMMHSLRSFELDELGIVAALQQMADDWNDVHEETFCKLNIEGRFEDLDKTQTLYIYRITQEALTNVAKHASAESVLISLSGWEVITLIIADDGDGVDPDILQEGMGMKGLRERVHLLEGTYSIETGHKKGLAIKVEFPRKSQVRSKSGVNNKPQESRSS